MKRVVKVHCRICRLNLHFGASLSPHPGTMPRLRLLLDHKVSQFYYDQDTSINSNNSAGHLVPCFNHHHLHKPDGVFQGY